MEFIHPSWRVGIQVIGSFRYSVYELVGGPVGTWLTVMDLPSSVWICSSSLAKLSDSPSDDDLLRFPSCLLYTKLVWVLEPNASSFHVTFLTQFHKGREICLSSSEIFLLQVIPFACKRKWRANDFYTTPKLSYLFKKGLILESKRAKRAVLRHVCSKKSEVFLLSP